MLCKAKTQPALIIKMTNNSIPYEDGAISHFFISLGRNRFKNICLTFGITEGVKVELVIFRMRAKIARNEEGKQRQTRNEEKTCSQYSRTAIKNMCPIVAPPKGAEPLVINLVKQV